MSDSPAPAASATAIRVEVVYADATASILRGVAVASGTTVEEAISASGILAALPADFTPAAVGIHGRIVDPNAVLREGDRIELYRPLKVDPKQARRRRAEKQRR